MVYPIDRAEAPSPLSHASTDALVIAYRHLCRRGARRFARAGLERNDLEQVAAIGLVKAARRYDPATGTPFEAFAWVFVVGELMHFVRDHEHAIRIPRRLVSAERAHLRARAAFAAERERDPSDRELARSVGSTPRRVAELRGLRSVASPLSLDAPDAREPKSVSPIDHTDRILLREALAKLSPAQRAVIAGVYFLGLTQHELALRLALPPKRVSRMHRAALDVLHDACAS